MESDAADAQSAAASLPAAGLDYVVQAGDTLSLISMRYGLDWQVVAQVNGITNTEVIEIGQVIRLPGVDEAAAATAPAATSTVTGTSTAGTPALTTSVTSTAASTADELHRGRR